jgi:hypothetical protein
LVFRPKLYARLLGAAGGHDKHQMTSAAWRASYCRPALTDGHDRMRPLLRPELTVGRSTGDRRAIRSSHHRITTLVTIPVTGRASSSWRSQGCENESPTRIPSSPICGIDWTSPIDVSMKPPASGGVSTSCGPLSLMPSRPSGLPPARPPLYGLTPIGGVDGDYCDACTGHYVRQADVRLSRPIRLKRFRR